jgi:hypothetical protein
MRLNFSTILLFIGVTFNAAVFAAPAGEKLPPTPVASISSKQKSSLDFPHRHRQDSRQGADGSRGGGPGTQVLAGTLGEFK